MKNLSIAALVLGIVVGVVGLCTLITRPFHQPMPAPVAKSTTPLVTTPARPETAAERLAKRQAFIHSLENSMLDKGHDFYLSLHGKNKDQLQVKTVLMSRPFVHNFTRKYQEAMRGMADLGFTKIIFTDGYDQTWTVPLSK